MGKGDEEKGEQGKGKNGGEGIEKGLGTKRRGREGRGGNSPLLSDFLAKPMLMTVVKKRDFSQHTLPSGRP